MPDGLIKLIQQHTTSNVTNNFVKTVQNLAKVHVHDVSKFTKSCMALGKFKGQEEFLGELHSKLIGKETSTLDEVKDVPRKTNESRAKLKQQVRRPQKLGTRGLQFQDEDLSDSDPALNAPGQATVPVTKKISFKKMSKDKAQSLKQYSERVENDSKHQEVKTGSLLVPELVSFPHTSSDATPLEFEPEQDEIFSMDDSDSASDDQILEEDRDWYDNDDDYGYQVAGAFNMTEAAYAKDALARTFRKENRNSIDTKSQIHLSSMTLSQRKELIPPFLLKYKQDPSFFANMSNLTDAQDLSNRRIIDPIRNPDSDFSLNAKKGSRAVAERRSKEVHKAKMEETNDLTGTAIGQIIGLKDGEKTAVSQSTDSSNNLENSKENFESIQRVRKTLPAFKARSELLQIIRDNQVIVVIGETGSGKTTQLAQFLEEDGYCNGGQLIGCTQPRRVAAISVATRVAMEKGVKLGNEVGYSIRFEDKTTSRTKIKFMTDGILLRETLMSTMLEKYSCIIMDEAHERSLNTDILFGIFKNLLAIRRDLKLIITSATMNANKFSQFFGGSPMFTIPGRTFPVETVFSRHPVSDYVESAILQASKIHLSSPVSSGDILIFMTGQEDIEATCAGLREKLSEINTKKRLGNMESTELNDIEILPIYSALPADVQGKIFNCTPNKRKVVVATNIAETSLTVDGVKYVIDCGYSKLKVYNPQIGLDILQIAPISMASANQRSGRAGRTGPGIAYRLYTEDSFFDDMYVQTIPEIQRTNLSNTLLLLKYLGVKDVLAFPFVDPPPEQIVMSSLFELWTVGALDNFGKLTELGGQMASFPLQPSLSKMLLSASQSGCSEEVLTIVSMLSVPQIFYRPKERQEESDQARTRFFVPESDHLTLLNVFSQWKANNFSSAWCRRNFLQFKSLQRAKSIRDQLRTLMEKKRIIIVSSGTDWDIIRKCVCSGYAHQAARLSGLNKYVHLRNGLELRIHPASALFRAGDLPPYVVYHEMLLTSNEYINTVTAVDPFWLMKYGLLFYNVSRRREDVEDSGIYADESPERIKDNLDLSIEQCMMKKEIVKQKLLKDTITASADISCETNKKKPESVAKKPGGQIGFKRRRPL
ncbi:LANO_0H24168g1_1 [Lachancea nothofagi CBS 11611]|uniref:Pre-mRNA-splicing factor ATP-dependent RNA helicase PRP16 n=1 Tax=Lachancea nothofagi CBS 11611 TaxID=1266666 RepID=A0A1G4KNZ1_9SACH|nr:LANO_0H24168g1_1 [Lachancea nothofagi CBS 11611]